MTCFLILGWFALKKYWNLWWRRPGRWSLKENFVASAWNSEGFWGWLILFTSVNISPACIAHDIYINMITYNIIYIVIFIYFFKSILCYIIQYYVLLYIIWYSDIYKSADSIYVPIPRTKKSSGRSGASRNHSRRPGRSLIIPTMDAIARVWNLDPLPLQCFSFNRKGQEIRLLCHLPSTNFCPSCWMSRRSEIQTFQRWWFDFPL